MRCKIHCPKPSSKLDSLIYLVIALATVSTVLTTVGNALNFLDHFIWPLFILGIIGAAGALRLAGFVIQASLPANRKLNGLHQSIQETVSAHTESITNSERPAIEQARKLPAGMSINEYWENMPPISRK